MFSNRKAFCGLLVLSLLAGNVSLVLAKAGDKDKPLNDAINSINNTSSAGKDIMGHDSPIPPPTLVNIDSLDHSSPIKPPSSPSNNSSSPPSGQSHMFTPFGNPPKNPAHTVSPNKPSGLLTTPGVNLDALREAIYNNGGKVPNNAKNQWDKLTPLERQFILNGVNNVPNRPNQFGPSKGKGDLLSTDPNLDLVANDLRNYINGICSQNKTDLDKCLSILHPSSWGCDDASYKSGLIGSAICGEVTGLKDKLSASPSYTVSKAWGAGSLIGSKYGSGNSEDILDIIGSSHGFNAIEPFFNNYSSPFSFPRVYHDVLGGFSPQIFPLYDRLGGVGGHSHLPGGIIGAIGGALGNAFGKTDSILGKVANAALSFGTRLLNSGGQSLPLKVIGSALGAAGDAIGGFNFPQPFGGHSMPIHGGYPHRRGFGASAPSQVVLGPAYSAKQLPDGSVEEVYTYPDGTIKTAIKFPDGTTKNAKIVGNDRKHEFD
jgi:hypothetical protein